MPSCSILGCKNRSRNENVAKGGISYHKFPNTSNILAKWIEATGRRKWVPTKHSVVCSAHFSNAYLKTEKLHRFLLKNAIPTENVFYKSCDSRNNTDTVQNRALSPVVLKPVLIKADCEKPKGKISSSTDEYEIPFSPTLEVRADPLSDTGIPDVKEEDDPSLPREGRREILDVTIKEEPVAQDIESSANDEKFYAEINLELTEGTDITDLLKFESQEELEKELRKRILRERKFIKMIRSLKDQNLRLKQKVAHYKKLGEGSEL